MATSTSTTRPAGRVNRQRDLLDAAARLFRERGYDGASVRDIASACGMLPGSLYFHFKSKDEIYLSVQAEGIRHVTEAVSQAVSRHDDPWDRLTAACRAHLSVVLDESDFAGVLIRALPMENAELWQKICAMRDRYEDQFRHLIDDLPLPAGSNRKYLRLVVMGAMNWSPTWYRPGRDDPARIAEELLQPIRTGLEAGT